MKDVDRADFAALLHAVRVRCGSPYVRAMNASGTVLGEDGDRTDLARPLLPIAYLASDHERAAAFIAYAAAETQPQLSGMGDTVGVHCVVSADVLVSVYLDVRRESGPGANEAHARALWAHAQRIAEVVRSTSAG